MKKILVLLLFALFSGFFIISCEKDKNDNVTQLPTDTKATIDGEAFTPSKIGATKSEGKYTLSFESGDKKVEIITNDTIAGSYTIVSETLKAAIDLKANIKYTDGTTLYTGTSGSVLIIMGSDSTLTGTYDATLSANNVSIEIKSGSFLNIKPMAAITDTSEKLSPKSVEENKAAIEDAGIELVTTMSDMKTIESVDVLVNLGDILSSMETKKAFMSKDSKLFSTLETFAATANGEKKVNDVFHAMAFAKELGDDPESIKEVWDSLVGTYSWMPDLNDWDIVEGGNSVIFKFPSSDVSATNDATLTIFDYKGTIIENPIDDEYTGDLPISLKAELKVGTKTYITYTFAASYNTDGVPNAIASDLTIENYKFEVDIVNSTQAVSVNYKFLADNKVIMDLGANGEGLFTEDNYDDNTHTTTITHTNTYGYWDWVYNPSTGDYDQVWVTYTDTWEETNTDTEFEEILKSASAHFQLFDIAIRGDVDVKGLVDELRLIDDNDNISGSQADSLAVIQINKFVNLRLVQVSSNEILAKVEAYIVKEIDDYGYMDQYVDFRFIFKDGSFIDAETYFDQGFDSFIDELNSLITDLNNEYTLDLETIEY